MILILTAIVITLNLMVIVTTKKRSILWGVFEFSNNNIHVSSLTYECRFRDCVINWFHSLLFIITVPE